jgi:hypothetical protein
MNDRQLKAVKKLKFALNECANADVMILAFSELGMFALPRDKSSEMPESHEASSQGFMEWIKENTVEVGCPGLAFDGGAGV